ncbi:conserved hypothetical protein [Histoplasma mississippiense (nom. inval.)]|uniref:conserved hypothetical protein n=1 Tax=Ajellomyces capsulatus (strain NAm1 / WU24) TaxID=2059318 RepID=UPI000157CAD9|nr:conserved hypothetical protein [Histoplasma mississippiense (nom. inval.)]EDN09128.1 conserved hypothetical protein [Histoplasma mississippiense (nom. inval.)]
MGRTSSSRTLGGSPSQQGISNSDNQSTTPTLHSGATPPPGSSPLKSLQVYSTRIPQTYITPFCGASAGVASGIVTCPLDVIKTKLQAQGGFQLRRNGKLIESGTLYRGMFGTGKMIWRDEDNWWLARAYASLTAGTCSTVATNPIWVIKTRLMSQGFRPASNGYQAPWYYKNTLDAARKMYASEGLRAFYSGLTPALLGLSHVAIQFPLYEYFKMAFTGFGIGEHPDAGYPHWTGISAATFLSKVCASTATYPHEVLRTRLQTQQRSSPAFSSEGIAFRGGLEQPQDHGRPPGTGAGASSSDGMRNRPRYRGVIRTCQTILMEEGWRAFYAGIGTNLFRAVPAAMTTMLTYEYLRNIIHWMQHEGEQVLIMSEEDGSSAY